MTDPPKTAMVLAAGLGQRMRPLTDTRPKALIEVGGKALVDHILDRLVEVGVKRAVVNVHAFADQLETHLAGRRAPEILISDERGRLLETGGGLKAAQAFLGEAPIWAANSDYVWTGDDDALARLAAAFDPACMDALVTVVPKARTLGFDTPGDFFWPDDSGQPDCGPLAHRGDRAAAPLHCFGVQIIDPRLVYAEPGERFSLLQVWLAAQARGRLYGFEPEGQWMQVGDPASLQAVQTRLAAGA